MIANSHYIINLVFEEYVSIYVKTDNYIDIEVKCK